MNAEKKCVSTHDGAALVWVIFLSIVLFSGKPDLHDLLIAWLAKLAQ